MNRRTFVLSTLPLFSAVAAQSPIDSLIEAGERLLEENLDPALLRALRAGDLQSAERIVIEAARRFQGEYVLDLAALEEAVQLALPLLESHPDTRGYAAWLRARLDYFEVADSLEKSLPAPPPTPDRPPPPPRVPTPAQQRKAWDREVKARPQPRGASQWVPRLKPVFRRAGVPAQLVWLAEVESSFDPAARSPVGAAGLYQLMPRTAEGLGLQVKPRDERLIPEMNAQAAAKYLGQLYRQFNDWPLALAAYNAGPGRVSDLLKRRRARSFDAIAPSLPAETQMYVPKLEMVLRQREGVALASLRAAGA
jgi:membrane-bound lytic murein transglycosylase D